MLVKDYRGKLISKSKARKITNEDGTASYYEIGVSCIKMEDGKYYRTTTGKIIFDNSIQKWVKRANFIGTEGLLEDGTFGYFSNQRDAVTILYKGPQKSAQITLNVKTGAQEKKDVMVTRWKQAMAINEAAATKNGFVESLYDGKFYQFEFCNEEEKERIKTPGIPSSERTNTYSLDDDKDYRQYLEQQYDENKITVNRTMAKIAKKYIPFTWGLEMEVQNGHIPKRIREPLGFRACRDGSLDTGIEYVSVPVEGGKGLATMKKMCEELTRRCQLSNKCSVHIHFGDVRRDRLYVLSLWTLLTKIQDEFRTYFPYSRTNSIREDGKIYAKLLPNLALDTKHLLTIKDDEKFKARVTEEFAKIYTWLNNGHVFGETFDEAFVKETKETLIKGKVQKQYCYRTKKFNYTTKLPRHAIQGHKWQRPQR